MRARHTRLAGLLAAACCLVPATDAGAATAPLTTLPTGAARLTAYAGWVVFSDRSAPGMWSLMAWHAGSIATLPVPARAVPFDAEAGPGPAGRPTLVFSKCARDPRMHAGTGLRAADVEWQTASGCRIYELALPGGTPQLVKTIRPPRGSSDATPAIWHGGLAFARYRRTGPPRLLLSAGSHLAHLGGGPASCPAPSTISGVSICRRGERVVRTRVGGLSMSAGALVYEWVAEVPGAFVGPLADPEIRIDPLRDGRQSESTKLLDMSFASGACGGGESESPNAVNGEALYVANEFVCEPSPERRTSTFELQPPVGKPRSSGTGAHVLALAVAWDRGTAFWIGLAPTPGPRCTTNHTCEREEAERAAECPPQSVCNSGRQLSEAFSCEAGEGVCTLMRTTGLRAASGAGVARPARAARTLRARRLHTGRH